MHIIYPTYSLWWMFVVSYQVTFVGQLGANREKTQVVIRFFYGHLIFAGDSSPSPSPRQLLSLKENIPFPVPQRKRRTFSSSPLVCWPL